MKKNPITKRALYRGFSTFTSLATRGKTFSTADVETVKRDLINHIYTIPGERVHRPDYGTRIPLLAFEQCDQTTIDVIKEDLTKVVAADPRVRLIDLAVLPLPNNNAIVAVLDLYYVKLDLTETMSLDLVSAG